MIVSPTRGKMIKSLSPVWNAAALPRYLDDWQLQSAHQEARGVDRNSSSGDDAVQRDAEGVKP